MAGGVHGRGACMVRGVHGRGHVWWGDMFGVCVRREACMAGGCMAGAGMVGGHACHTCPPPDTTRYGQSMRGRYAFLFEI